MRFGLIASAQRCHARGGMRIEREQIFRSVAAERRSIADLIDTLDADSLATPSLCSGWDVKTVAAHLVSVFADNKPLAGSSGLLFGTADSTARSTNWRGAVPTTAAADIARTLRQRADHRLSPPVTGPLSGLTDVLVHSGDIRIPLDLPFRPYEEEVSWALDFLTGPRPLEFVPRGRLRGIALHSTDIGRSWVLEPRSTAPPRP